MVCVRVHISLMWFLFVTIKTSVGNIFIIFFVDLLFDTYMKKVYAYHQKKSLSILGCSNLPSRHVPWKSTIPRQKQKIKKLLIGS